MKKTIIIGLAGFSLALFSCGETVSPEEIEATVTEITTAEEENDALQAELEGIEAAEEELDAVLEDL